MTNFQSKPYVFRLISFKKPQTQTPADKQSKNKEVVKSLIWLSDSVLVAESQISDVLNSLNASTKKSFQTLILTTAVPKKNMNFKAAKCLNVY